MKIFLVALLLAFTSSSFAQTSAFDKKLIGMMKSGDLSELKQATKTAFNRRATDTALLDTAAEVLLTLAPNAFDNQIDTLAWICNLLGQSRNSRYYEALTTVQNEAFHKKLKKYAKKAARQVGPGDGPSYQKGMVKLKTSEYY